MPKSKNMYRTFDGKRYYLYDTGFPNQMKAKSKAKELRNSGYNVRIVKVLQSNTYAVYRRHKGR